MIQNTQIVYAKPPADGALPDPAGTFNVVHTPFDDTDTPMALPSSDPRRASKLHASPRR
jgi:hypothetical protein